MLLLELLQVVAPTMYSAVMCSVMQWGGGTTERHDEDNRVSGRWWGRGRAGDGDGAALAHDCKRVIGSQTSEGERGAEGQGRGMHASESTRATCERCAVHRGRHGRVRVGAVSYRHARLHIPMIGSDRGRGTHVREQRSGMVRCRGCNRKGAHAV